MDFLLFKNTKKNYLDERIKLSEKDYWRNSEPYHLVEVSIQNKTVIFKDWFDSGKDPNRYDWSFEEFKKGKGKSDIEYHLGNQVYLEILQVINTKSL